MLSESVREKALELAACITQLEEYKNFLETERELRNDEVAQEMLVEFQQKQQDFMMKQMSGEFDHELLSQLTEIQSKLNTRESVVRFIDSYNKLLAVVGEIMDLISERIELDIGEVYRR
ncbi:MAG: YlbF family regulator [Archaeoglobales archaeon]|nr:YlbF family regulator [Archaeoglobales archaeon]